jgi:hypothetical protein
MPVKVYQTILLVSVAAAVGCEGGATERVPVAGKVLVDGQPLSSGTIQFVPKAGRPASSNIQSDGSFELTIDSVGSSSRAGLPRGTYQVQVSSSKVIDDATIQWNAPQKYADFRTSGLEVDVSEPSDHLTIQLTTNDASNASLTETTSGDSKSAHPSSAVQHPGSAADPTSSSSEGRQP